MLLDPGLGFIDCLGDPVPRLAISLLQLGIGVYLLPEVFFLSFFLLHQVLVLEARQASNIHLQAVFEAEDLRSRLPGLFRPTLRVVLQCANAPLQHLNNDRSHGVAVKDQRGVGGQTLRRSRMPRNKHQISVSGALRIPLQIVLAVDWLTVFVHAVKSHVQVVARVCEIVRIAPEERSLLFRCKDQPHVRVFLVAIEPIFAALVQCDDIRTEAGLFGAFLLNFGNYRSALRELFFCVLRSLGRGVHAIGHVFVRHQHVHL